MFNLYDKLTELCKAKGVSGSRMCVDLSISKSTMTDLKNGRIKSVSASNAQKMAAYFGITVDELYGTEIKNSPDVEEKPSREDLEMLKIFSALPEEKRKELMNYLKYLSNN